MDKDTRERLEAMESEIKLIKNSISDLRSSIDEIYDLVGNICPTIPAITRAIIALDHRLPVVEESEKILEELTFKLPRKMYLSDEDLDLIRELFKVYFLDTGVMVERWGERIHSRFLLEGLHYYSFNSGYQSEHTRKLSKNTVFYTVNYDGVHKEFGSIDYFSWIVHKFRKADIKDPSKILASLIYLVNYTLHRYGTFMKGDELGIFVDKFPGKLPEALDVCFEEWLEDIEPLNGSWLNEPCFNYLNPEDLVSQGYMGLEGLYLNPDMDLYDPINHIIKGFKNAGHYVPYVCTTQDLDQRNFLIIRDDLPETKHSELFSQYPDSWTAVTDLSIFNPIEIYKYIRKLSSKYSDNIDCIYGDTFLLCTICEYEGISSRSLAYSLPKSVNNIPIWVTDLNSEMIGVIIGTHSQFLRYVLAILRNVYDDYRTLWDSVYCSELRLSGWKEGKFTYTDREGNYIELNQTEAYRYFEAWCKFPENTPKLSVMDQYWGEIHSVLTAPYDFSQHSCEVVTVDDKQEIHLKLNGEKLICSLYKDVDKIFVDKKCVVGMQNINSSEYIHHICNLTVYSGYELCSIILEFMYYFDTDEDIVKIEFENGILNLYVTGENAGIVELLPKPGRKTTRKTRTSKSKLTASSNEIIDLDSIHTSMFNSNVTEDDVYL